MSRYIDADALIRETEERLCKDCDRRKGMKNGKYKTVYKIGEAPCRACDIDGMKFELENAPTADVVLVKHGHWIWDDEGYHCSECWYHAQGNTLECMTGEWGYCPVCGTHMEREEE